MKCKILFSFLLFFSVYMLKAQELSKQDFQQAYQKISAMLEGKQPLDFEKAVFLTENAYRDNAIVYEYFKAALDVHSKIIEQLIKANDKHDWKQFVRGNRGATAEMEAQVKERYRKALANWAIFTYLTDTLTFNLAEQRFLHVPYTYSNEDPFGTADWKNSQTLNLLEIQKGNCYALVTLFKIFSERFKSEADIVTAPQHIYIEHRDPHGSRFNIEVATRSFPDMGSIQTLTYTTREALLNDISMRKLDLKQSVGLCLVYLAKGYEYKNKVKDDEFVLACANTALQHDPKNLNALLLMAQVYEQRVMKKEMPTAPYEKMLAELYELGYRQMPDDMKNIILSKIQGTPSTGKPTDKTPNPFADIGERARYVTLSNGLFEELHSLQKIVKYSQTIFDTEKNKIVNFLDEDNSTYQVDPVVFALSVDPLTSKYPELTPYQFAGDNPILFVDLDGLEPAYKLPGSDYIVPASDYFRHTPPSKAEYLHPYNKEKMDKSNEATKDAISFMPILDLATDGYDTYNEASKGNYLQASLSGLSLIPGADFFTKPIKLGLKHSDDVADAIKVGGKVVDNIDDFYKKASKLDIGERIALYKLTAEKFAKENNLSLNKELMKKNKGRTIYSDPETGLNYSLDTQHGAFEVLDKKGRHQGEIDFGSRITKKKDKTGGHDIVVK